MKKILNNIALLGVILALLSVVSCESELLQEYESVDVVAAPSLEFSLTNIQDSTLHVDYNLGSQQGWLFISVLEGSEETVATPTPEAMRFLTVEAAVFEKSVKIDAQNAGSEGEVLVTGLKQNTEYTVFAMPGSVDGVDGEIIKASVQTSDAYAPVVSGISPSVSSTAAQAVDFEVEITFDEPVVVNNADGFLFRYLNIVTFEFTDLAPAEVSADGNVVTLATPQEAIPGQYVFLTISDDAVHDRSANAYAGITSGLTEEGSLAGNYWRVAYTPAAADLDTITPTIGEAQQEPDFTIVLTYEYPMDFKRSSGAVVYEPTDIIIRYTQGGVETNVQVPAENITFDGNVVTITQPRTPVFGETITLLVNENAFRTRYGSPVAAITAEDDVSWLLSYGYTVDKIIHDYSVLAISTFGDPPAQYTFDVTIVADAEDENKVIITGLEGSQLPVEGYFNGDFATLTIPQDQSLGDLMGDGSDVLLWSDTSESGDLIGYIQPDGSIIMDWASYIVGGEYDGYFYDRYYDSVWTIVEATKFDNHVTPAVKIPTVKRNR